MRSHPLWYYTKLDRGILEGSSLLSERETLEGIAEHMHAYNGLKYTSYMERLTANTSVWILGANTGTMFKWVNEKFDSHSSIDPS